MPLNLGYIEGTCQDRDVVVRVYYDTAWLADDPTRDPNAAPLIDGPRGYCLDLTNISGRLARLTVTGVGDQPITMTIQKGDPVTTGPQSGRSRTAAQLAAQGYATRGSVGNFQVECS